MSLQPLWNELPRDSRLHHRKSAPSRPQKIARHFSGGQTPPTKNPPPRTADMKKQQPTDHQPPHKKLPRHFSGGKPPNKNSVPTGTPERKTKPSANDHQPTAKITLPSKTHTAPRWGALTMMKAAVTREFIPERLKRHFSAGS